MKHLILFILCQGSIDGYSQVEICGQNRFYFYTYDRSDSVKHARPDTLASHLLISHNPPSFAHSIEGYCVVFNGSCIGKHLVYRSSRRWMFGRRTWSFRAIGNGYDVFMCRRKEVGHD